VRLTLLLRGVAPLSAPAGDHSDVCLTRLAIAALYDLQIEPGFLHSRARRRRTDAFDGGDGAVPYRANRQHA
jgi:hypothetical protein